MKQQINERLMQVRMFGRLELTYLGKSVSSDDIRSEMSELLLVYMLTHRTNQIATQEICEQLWEDDECDNPIGALKNLMYRLRSTLKKVWQDDFILTGRGTYQWNPEIEIEVDFETLDSILRKSRNEKQMEILENGVALYRDIFLPKYRKHHWIIQLATYYQSQFLSIVEKLSSLYLYQGEYHKLEVLCNRALSFDKYDLPTHYLLFQSYIKQNKKQVAIEHYHALSKFLMDDLGIVVSSNIKELYVELMKSDNSIELDLSIIERDLKESLSPKGAFVCEYGVFKEIYRLQARQSARMGMSVYCALLSADILLDIPHTSDMYKKIMKKAMDSLQGLILNTLRVGDTASRYSISQYVVLLPTCTYESSVMVMERLQRKFFDHNAKLKMDLKYEVRELSFDMEDIHGE